MGSSDVFFAIIVLVVVGMLAAVAYYIPAPAPLKWIIPAVIVLLGAVVILMRLGGMA